MTAVLAGPASSLQNLVNAVVSSAPDCLRERVLLRAVDWSSVAPAKVAQLMHDLEREGVKLPRWLAQAILVAGHCLPASQQSALDAPLSALGTLNRFGRPGQGPEAGEDIASLVQDLAYHEDIDSDLVAAGVRQLVGLDQPALATRLALAHWRRSPQTLRLVQKHLDQVLSALPKVRLRVTSVSNPGGLAADLRAAFASTGFDATVRESDYGQAFTELLRPADQPRDALIVLLDIEALHPRDWRQDAEQAEAALQQKLDLLAGALEAYADAGHGPVLVNTLPAASAPTVGLIDAHHPAGASRTIRHVNERLIEAARRNGQIVLIEANCALSGLEPRRWIDPKLQFYGRMPYSADANRHLASAFAGAYRTLKLGTAKVLVLDMDNTLWGGIFGEDGVAKLLCDDEFPGNVFKALQHECLRLKSQGVLLAILSKNNPDAVTAFRDHPGLLLREDDFVGMRINWEPKPDNIRSLAADLNLGLDSFVFLDDSPHERAAMRRMCPEVVVPELPDDPAARPSWLRRLAVTWPARLTEEDARRSEMYRAERQRSTLERSAGSFEDYLRDLGQTLVVERMSAATLPRIAQMHLRTNQFNLTTERYDEVALQVMMTDARRHLVLLGRALDKFGDHGIAICGTAGIEGGVATLHSLLMSCRIVGRGIEPAFLGEVLRTLASRGVGQVRAAYIPTRKNMMVRDFYRNAGFLALEPDGETTWWGLDLASGAPLPRAPFIDVRWADAGGR